MLGSEFTRGALSDSMVCFSASLGERLVLANLVYCGQELLAVRSPAAIKTFLVPSSVLCGYCHHC